MTSARTAYRENDVRGASPVRLVVLLYDQMIHDLTQAADAIEQNDIPLRARSINHAILVIGHLQSPLDFANGGKVAHDLNNFYNVLRKNLVQVQFFPSKDGMNQLITDVLAVREAWIEVGRDEKPSVTSAAQMVPGSPESEPARLDWKG
jgi:flagellar protein FliS